MLLKDKVLVVSGIGPGLGRSIAVRGAEQGADVVLAARTESRLAEVAKEVTALGRRVLTVPADISDPQAAQRLADATVAEFGRADVLVHNALAMPPIKLLGEVDLDAVQASFNTNVIGALRLTRLFTPALEQAAGSVIMINSLVVRFSQLTMGPYKAS